MFENSTVPFTIIKQKNEDATNNNYNWKKILSSSDELKYTVENITLVQEPIETLSLSVSFSRVKSNCDPDPLINCPNCGIKSLSRHRVGCPFCMRHNYIKYSNALSECACNDKEGNLISYDLIIDFDNYLHEFSNNYIYEVSCKLLNVPEKCLFSCRGLRLHKRIVFDKCYASTAYYTKLDMSNLELYFCIRRLDQKNREINISTMHSFMSIYRNSDNDRKVILQGKDGQIIAHKSVLSHSSDVFRAAFVHEMKEKQEGIMKIAEFDCKVIETMVNFLYTGKLGKVTGMVKDLFKLAHQYQIHELCRRCEEYYMFNLNLDEHIIEILELVDLYELKELKNSSEKYIQRYEQKLSQLPSYQEYLCESITIEKAVKTLIFADKYEIVHVKTYALDFIKLNFKKMVESDDFMKLFRSRPNFMKEVYVYYCKGKE